MKKKVFISLSALMVSSAAVALAATSAAVLQVGAYKDMAPISLKDSMTPDHIPSGAAVVVACYLSDGNTEASIPARIGDLYDSATKPYYHVYQKANTIVYDTTIHQQSSPTYGQKSPKIIADAKDLKAAFTNDKAIVAKALTASQKTRDANNKPTNTLVTSQQVEAAFTQLNNANTSAGIYDAAKLKTFCKK